MKNRHLIFFLCMLLFLVGYEVYHLGNFIPGFIVSFESIIYIVVEMSFIFIMGWNAAKQHYK